MSNGVQQTVSHETKHPLTDYRDRDLEHRERRVHDASGDLGHEGRADDTPTIKGFYGHIGNAGVLGLAAHAVTLMLLATQFMGWRGVTSPAAYSGTVWFFAGLYMFTVAQWCLVKGETFAYLVFGVFSGFYLSYAAILTPAFGVAAAFANSGAEELQALGIYLMVWNAAFFIIFVASLRTNLALVIVFFGVIMGVWCLGAMYFEMATIAQAAGKGSASKALALSKAGGAFLFISASSGFYLVIVQLFESVDWPFALPVGDLAPLWPKRKTD